MQGMRRGGLAVRPWEAGKDDQECCRFLDAARMDYKIVSGNNSAFLRLAGTVLP